MIKKYQSIVKKTLLERARLLLILCQCGLEPKSKFRLMCEGGYLNEEGPTIEGWLLYS